MPFSTAASEQKGLVFNIQRFSVHDGPGIRTTVFLKGCPLRCRWCSNPESQLSLPNLMIRNTRCRACGACAAACPRQAIALTAENGRVLDWSRCDQCLQCVEACLYGALVACGQYRGVEEILAEVRRDEAFYRNSGGGLTVSGGEPLVQAEFLGRLLTGAKQAGLHAVLDTTGHAPWGSIEKLLPLVDLLLWDVKHLDPWEHRRMTGVDNRLILENLRKAAETAELWLRVPLLAGFNDSESHLREITALAKEVGARKISLLAYHEGGRSKCGQMGRPYPCPEGLAPGDEHLVRLRDLVEKEGLQAGIGN